MIGRSRRSSFSLPANAALNTTACEVRATQPDGLLQYASYFVSVGASFTSGAIALQVLGDDGTWRTTPATVPTPPALASSTNFAGALQTVLCPVRGLRWIVTTVFVSTNPTYVEISGID
jgi:hypothetical protein